jgi:hypothetical protein
VYDCGKAVLAAMEFLGGMMVGALRCLGMTVVRAWELFVAGATGQARAPVLHLRCGTQVKCVYCCARAVVAAMGFLGGAALARNDGWCVAFAWNDS